MLIKSMGDEIKFYQEEIERSNYEADATKTMFRQIQEPVQTMVEKFKRCKFLLNVASQMNYEDGIVFTENNIVNYLAELEEYVCALITVTAFKKDDQHPATSAIPLNQLNNKDFTKEKAEVDPTIVGQYTDDIIENAILTGKAPGEDIDFFTTKRLQAHF